VFDWREGRKSKRKTNQEGDCELMKMMGGLVNGDSDGGLEGGETKA
jgi:hypothetical protein